MPLFEPPSDWAPPSELPDLRRAGIIAFDIENNDEGLSAGRGSSWPTKAGWVSGVSAAWQGGSFYAPVRHPNSPECFDQDAVKRWVSDHARSEVRIVTHHGSHDWGWMKSVWDIDPPDHMEDTEAAAMSVDENRLNYSLDALCRWQGVEGKDEDKLKEAAAAYGYHPKSELWKMPARFVGPYAEQDAQATLDLFMKLEPELERQGITEAYRLEMDIMPMVIEMRRRGIRIDMDAAESARDRLMRHRDRVLRALARKLGLRNATVEQCRSSRTMEAWFRAENIDFPRTPKTNVGSFSAKWMRKHPHWLPRMVARVEQLEDAATKFLQGYIIDFASNGRLHASINQFRGEEGGTRSFRFSYSGPPLQQMPSRDPVLTALIRGLFMPEPGELWLAADYSQQEYRLIVHYANLLGCTKAGAAAQMYIDDPATDFHEMVSDWTGLERKPAKDTNFAKAFGAGVPTFADMINKSVEEAQDIYDQYDRELPFVKQLSEQCQQMAARRGYIKLIDGAKSHFDSWELRSGREPAQPSRAAAIAKWGPEAQLRRAFCHKGMSRLIQGSAARQTKMAMRNCWREGLVPMLQMHDELDFSIGDPATGTRVAELMRDAVPMSLPMKVDAEIGVNWGDAKHPLDTFKTLISRM